ncbi:MAG: zf-HC2 domain-containing protein [Chloroflexi bacterium]|nr:zf-HC2 domain-containing protein [Chloroflexota bacterium]
MLKRWRKNQHQRVLQLLSEYIDGRLSREKVLMVEEHTQKCASCRQYLESLRTTVALLHRVADVEPPRSFALSETEASAPSSSLARLQPKALRWATAFTAFLLVLVFAGDSLHLFETKSKAPQEEALRTETGMAAPTPQTMAAPQERPPAAMSEKGDVAQGEAGFTTPTATPSPTATAQPTPSAPQEETPPSPQAKPEARGRAFPVRSLEVALAALVVLLGGAYLWARQRS